jgi:iron complex outermembrane receptor protein
MTLFTYRKALFAGAAAAALLAPSAAYAGDVPATGPAATDAAAATNAATDATAAAAAAQPVPDAVPEEAQDSAAPSDGEIIVTARRVEETLQRVPAAVSAFNERALERIQAQDTTGLQGAVPNLNIAQGRGSSNATNIFIRGVGQPDALQTFDPAVGVYIDGVYLSRIRGTQLDLLDLERVEVLRGPQGTLYGKNTIGGALSLVSRRPGQEFRGSASLSLGSYDYNEIRLTASGPVTDTLAAGFAVLHSQRDGFVEDTVLDRDYNDKNTRAFRGTLAFTPNDRLRIDLSGDYSQDDSSLSLGQPINSLVYLFTPTVSIALPTNPTTYDFTARASPTLPNSTKLRHWGTSMNIAYDVSSAVTLRSITAFRQLDTKDYVDIDATPLQVGDVLVDVDQNQVSQEFQINVTTDRLTAVAGLYYLREHIESHQEAFGNNAVNLTGFRGALPEVVLGPTNFPDFLRTVDDELETTSYAAYANLSYEILPRLRLSGGIRFSSENKDYFRTTSTFSNSSPILRSATPFNFAADNTWENFSPMASIDYQFSDAVMVYARYARGFKSGGFNGRANSATERTQYEPETANTYEAGIRSTIGGQLRLNLTGFYNDYRNFQARVSGTGLDPVTNLPTAQLSVLNAGKLNIKGVELEAAWTPIRGLLIDAQVGYLDAKYDEFADARFPGGSRAFQTPAFAPEWTVRVGAQYEADLGTGGFLTFGGQARHRSETALAVDNTTISTNPALITRIEGLFADPYWVADARIVWDSPDRKLSLGLYGQNIFDEVYKTEGQEFSSVGNIRTVYYGAPMTWYVRGTVRF